MMLVVMLVCLVTSADLSQMVLVAALQLYIFLWRWKDTKIF